MTTPAAPLNAWDMQPGETALSYQAFQIMRDMGPTRTLEAVARMLSKSRQLLQRWSTANGWPARLAAFDAEAARRASERSLEDHAEARARLADIGAMLTKQGARRLSRIPELDYTFDPREMSPAEAIQAIRVGAAVESEARQLAKRLEVSGPGGGPVESVTRVVFEWADANDVPPDDPDASDQDADAG